MARRPRCRLIDVRIAAFALVSVLSASAAAAQQGSLPEIYAEAQQAQRNGDLRAAASHYEKIVAMRPDVAEAFANLGSIYYQLGEDSKAADRLRKAIEIKPQLAAPHFFLGVVSARQKAYESAIRSLETSARLDPSNGMVPIYLGEAYHAVRRIADAAEQFWRATRVADFRADAHYLLNRSYGKLAEQALSRLSREYPESYFAKLSRGHLNEGRKDWEEAEKAYREAAIRRPDADGLPERIEWVRRARAGNPTGRPPTPSGGRSSLLGLLYDPPSDSDVERMLGERRNREIRRLAANATAEDLYRQAHESEVTAYLAARWIASNDPSSYRAHQLRGELHEARGEIDEAVREYRLALRRNPGLRDVHFAIGSLLWSVSRLDEALPELERELEVSPNHPQAHYEIADILQVRGQREDAKRHLLEAIRFAPGMVEARLALERIHFAEGELDEALAQMREAVRLAPANPTPHYRISMIQRRLGNAEESLASLREFERLRSE